MNRFAILILLILSFCASNAFGQTRRPARRGKSKIVRRVAVAPKKKLRLRKKTAARQTAAAAITTASGLTYFVTDAGGGKQLKAGDTVVVNYTGLLTNGVKFDSSLDRGTPISFELGANRVIKGWDEALQKLRVGDRATLVIPPQLGYGAKGAGAVIPPNATLIFIVEIMDVR